MKLRDRFAELARKYKHAWVFLYILIYMPWFMWLEKHVTTHYHVIQIRLDEHIPFIEYFIIPYLMWFLFIAVVFLYFFFTDVKGFYKLAAFMFTGMTVFLIISTVFPNGQDLRPVIFERDNIFVDMVRTLYRTDTCTNVFPSLHVFNSLSVCAAIADSEALKKHRGVCIGAYVLAGVPEAAFGAGCAGGGRHGRHPVPVRICAGQTACAGIRGTEAETAAAPE